MRGFAIKAGQPQRQTQRSQEVHGQGKLIRFLFELKIGFDQIELFELKKKKQYQQYAKAIQTKAAALNLKYNELKLKEQNMKHMVPLDQYNKLKAHLNSITKRHEIFRNVLLNDPNSTATNAPGVASMSNPNLALLASVPGSNLAALNLESDNFLKSSNFVNQSYLFEPEKPKSQFVPNFFTFFLPFASFIFIWFCLRTWNSMK